MSQPLSIPCGVVQSTLEGGLTGTCCDVQATFLRCRSAALRHRSNALRHRSKELKHRSNELRHRRNLLNAVSEHVMRRVTNVMNHARRFSCALGHGLGCGDGPLPWPVAMANGYGPWP